MTTKRIFELRDWIHDDLRRMMQDALATPDEELIADLLFVVDDYLSSMHQGEPMETQDGTVIEEPQ